MYQDNQEYIQVFLSGVKKICDQISSENINLFINELFEAWQRNNTIFLIGNGGSAGTAIHFAGDLNNCTANIENCRPIRAMSLNENIVRLSALVNDRGWDKVYTEQLRNYFKAGDVVIGISVHGGSGKDKAGLWSQNLLEALQYTKDNGGKALGLAGFDGGAMKELCDVCVIVPYETTPHVEGFHLILQHLISDRLTEKIRNLFDSVVYKNEKK